MNNLGLKCRIAAKTVLELPSLCALWPYFSNKTPITKQLTFRVTEQCADATRPWLVRWHTRQACWDGSRRTLYCYKPHLQRVNNINTAVNVAAGSASRVTWLGWAAQRREYLMVTKLCSTPQVAASVWTPASHPQPQHTAPHSCLVSDPNLLNLDIKHRTQ